MPLDTYSLTIGTLGKTCGVSPPTIRYYEQINLLPPAERNTGGQRRYGRTTVERLTFIRRCRAFGFSTKQVRTMLDVKVGAVKNCVASREIAQARVDDVAAQIADLRALRKDLQNLIAVCDTTCGVDETQTCGAFTELRLPS